jgi:hypothetical protein
VSPIGDGQELIDWLEKKIQGPDKEKAQTNGHATGRPASPSPTDEMVIEKCRAAENATKFSDLFDHGDVHTHHGGDDSAADLSLLDILRFYTEDEAQLERLFSQSALGQRDKWRRRDDYRKRTISKALSDVGKTYDWPLDIGHPLFSSSSDTPIHESDDENKTEDEIQWFSELGEPKPREYIIETVGVKGYPIIAYGTGGVAKSFTVLAAGISIASSSGIEEWLGLRIMKHGYVLYLDFELDVDEQHRRVHDLCAGMGIPVPKKLAYLSGVGIPTQEAFKRAYRFAEDYEPVAVIIDSVGIAMVGDMDRARDVNVFYRHYTEPFRRIGATPILVDHEGKRQPGEKHKDKSPIGSIYKTNNARSVLQFILDEYDKENSALDIQVRQFKTNFAPLEPFGARITFQEGKVSIERRDLPEEEMIDEDRKPVRERILTALKMEPQTVPELERHTGATTGTIYNNLAKLMDVGEVVEGGQRGRKKVYRLFSSSSPSMGVSSDDENNKGGNRTTVRMPASAPRAPVADENTSTVEELFDNPPDWLTSQLKVYRQNPDQHLKPLCTAVAAVVLGDGLRWEEVKEEVERCLR